MMIFTDKLYASHALKDYSIFYIMHIYAWEPSFASGKKIEKIFCNEVYFLARREQ